MITYIDLSHAIIDNMPTHPYDVVAGFPTRLTPIATYQKDGVANHALSATVHMGTHIDAPGHFTANDKKITDFPLSTFIGKAVVIDVQSKYEIGLEDVRNKVEAHDIVLFCTGFDTHFNQPDYFHEHPVLTRECAQYLVEQKVKMVGVDMPSVDKAPYEIHKLLLSNDILIIENLTNVQKLLGYTYIEVIALPLNIDAHGSPARVIAKIEA